MNALESKISLFFEAYAHRFNNGLAGKDPDIAGTRAAFAESFIAANPAGVYSGNNDDPFSTAILEGYAFYRSIGTQAMTISKVEVTSLDEFHAMAKVYWHSTYAKHDGLQVVIDFTVIYLLQIRADSLKIFGYITGDELGVLRENGLLPQA
jgi:hypothetical protein